MQLTYFDLAVIVILLVFAIRGAMRGFIAEIAGLLGLAVGLVLARTFFQQATGFVEHVIAPNAAPVVAFIALFLLGMLLVGLLARVLQRVLEVAFAGWIDSVMGIGAGLIKGALLCALVAYGALSFLPQLDDVRLSCTIPYLMDGVRFLMDALNISLPLPQTLSMSGH